MLLGEDLEAHRHNIHKGHYTSTVKPIEYVLTAGAKPEKFSGERADDVVEFVDCVNGLVKFVVFIVLDKLNFLRGLLFRSTEN